jgi:hypothetical protein
VVLPCNAHHLPHVIYRSSRENSHIQHKNFTVTICL